MVKLRVAKPRIPITDTRRIKPQPKQRDDIYGTPEFRQWRDAGYKASGGRCEDPEHQGQNPPPGRLYADHVIEIRDGGAPFDPRNRMMRCAPCHGRKTAGERAKRAGVNQG